MATLFSGASNTLPSAASATVTSWFFCARGLSSEGHSSEFHSSGCGLIQDPSGEYARCLTAVTSTRSLFAFCGFRIVKPSGVPHVPIPSRPSRRGPWPVLLLHRRHRRRHGQAFPAAELLLPHEQCLSGNPGWRRGTHPFRSVE